MGESARSTLPNYGASKFNEIRDYCRCDVLDTYFVFLRTRVLVGDLTLDDEQQLIIKAYRWIEQQASKAPIFQKYLEN